MDTVLLKLSIIALLARTQIFLACIQELQWRRAFHQQRSAMDDWYSVLHYCSRQAKLD